MKKEKKKESLEASAGILREPCQNLRIVFYETLPVSYFRCAVLYKKKNNEGTFNGILM